MTEEPHELYPNPAAALEAHQRSERAQPAPTVLLWAVVAERPVGGHVSVVVEQGSEVIRAQVLSNVLDLEVGESCWLLTDGTHHFVVDRVLVQPEPVYYPINGQA